MGWYQHFTSLGKVVYQCYLFCFHYQTIEKTQEMDSLSYFPIFLFYRSSWCSKTFFFFNHFLSISRTSLSHSFKVGLVSRLFLLSIIWNVFIFPSFLKNNCISSFSSVLFLCPPRFLRRHLSPGLSSQGR